MIKKNQIWFFFGSLIFIFFIAFMSKNSLNNFISDKMKVLNGKDTDSNVEEIIGTNYNYTKNGLNFEYTLLEFGSTGCTICKQMETELEKIRKSGTSKINVIFLNTTYPENQKFVKFYGISAIPMQVILDKNGIEIFKHYGFISAEDIIKETLTLNENKL